MNWPVTLTTERLILRPWRADDADALFAYASDPDIGPAAGWPPHKSVDESREVLKNVLMVPETYALTLRDSTTQDEPIGCVGLKIGEDSDLAIGDDQAELGYWLAKPFWGQGLMPEAVRETMRHGFCDLGLTAIWAGHYQSNDKSRRVQEKVGLRHQRTIVNRPLKLIGGHTNEEVNWLTCDQWLALQDPHATTCKRIARIRSGGQTGADRGAFDAARELDVPICGWCPPGGLAEDFPKPPGLLLSYPELTEGASEGYAERTAWNVRDSHATLIIAPAGLKPSSGTELTARCARQMGRPCIVISDISQVSDVLRWLDGLGSELTLNVAGPRESETPGTYALAREVVRQLLS